MSEVRCDGGPGAYKVNTIPRPPPTTTTMATQRMSTLLPGARDVSIAAHTAAVSTESNTAHRNASESDGTPLVSSTKPQRATPGSTTPMARSANAQQFDHRNAQQCGHKASVERGLRTCHEHAYSTARKGSDRAGVQRLGQVPEGVLADARSSVADIEALLIEALGTRWVGNARSESFAAAVRWEQVRWDEHDESSPR